MSKYNFDVTIPRNADSKICIDTAARYGYWERKDGAEGGGLWFELIAPPAVGTPAKLELVDFDGAYELPAQVATLLREHGYAVGTEFDA